MYSLHYPSSSHKSHDQSSSKSVYWPKINARLNHRPYTSLYIRGNTAAAPLEKTSSSQNIPSNSKALSSVFARPIVSSLLICLLYWRVPESPALLWIRVDAYFHLTCTSESMAENYCHFTAAAPIMRTSLSTKNCHNFHQWETKEELSWLELIHIIISHPTSSCLLPPSHSSNSWFEVNRQKKYPMVRNIVFRNLPFYFANCR